MENDKFKQFLIINQININKSSITCGNCHNWLTPPIYVENGVNNFCGQCTPESGARMLALEDLLKNFKYPCVNGNCELLLDYNGITKHAIYCSNAMTCSLCKTECDKRKLSQHLIAKHNAQLIDTDIPKFTINIKIPLIVTSNNLVEMYNTQFFFTCAQNYDLLKGTLVKLPNEVIVDTDKYTIRMTTNLGSMSIHEGTLQQFVETQSDGNVIEMYIGKANRCQLEVCLGPRENNIAPECPICMLTISSKLRQCVNGHNVCEDCGGKINSCPLCRMQIVDHVFNVQHLYPDAKWPCKNYKHGCMAYFHHRGDQQHLAVCAFRSIKCCACAQSVRQCDLHSHMQNNHALMNNFDILPASFKTQQKQGSCTGYIKFDSEIFKCRITTNETDMQFQCELAYSETKCHHQYRVEFHIVCDNSTTRAAHIINNFVCVNSKSCSIPWKKLNYNTSPILVRCCIFKENTPLKPCLPRVFFDVSYNDQPLGRIVMELRSDIAPFTAKNFRALCMHEKGYGYKGSSFKYNFLNGFYTCGAIAEHKPIKCMLTPERNTLKYSGPGTVVMYNTDTCCSKFIIIASEESPDWLNYKHCIVGQVVEGFDVVKRMSKGACITNCGQL